MPHGSSFAVADSGQHVRLTIVEPEERAVGTRSDVPESNVTASDVRGSKKRSAKNAGSFSKSGNQTTDHLFYYIFD